MLTRLLRPVYQTKGAGLFTIPGRWRSPYAPANDGDREGRGDYRHCDVQVTYGGTVPCTWKVVVVGRPQVVRVSALQIKSPYVGRAMRAAEGKQKEPVKRQRRLDPF